MAPVNVNVPVPVLSILKPFAPLVSMPEKVVLFDREPTVSVAGPPVDFVTVPLPESEPMEFEKPLTSKVPLAAILNSEASGAAKVAPNDSVPAFTFVTPVYDA